MGIGTGVNVWLALRLSIPMLGGGIAVALCPLSRRACFNGFWGAPIGMFSLPRGGSSGRVLPTDEAIGMGPFAPRRLRRGGSSSSGPESGIERVARRGIDGEVIGTGGRIAVVLRGCDDVVAAS